MPCCQHELLGQLSSDVLRPLLRHGTLRERLVAEVTDAARARLLELAGYDVQVLEFVPLEHTQKNVLLRATRTTRPPHDRERLAARVPGVRRRARDRAGAGASPLGRRRDSGVSCSELSLEAGIPLAGTTTRAERWLLVEHDGPWGRDAVPDSELR